jgi:hypothetical protein
MVLDFLRELLGFLLYDTYAQAEVETAGCLWEWFRSPRRAVLTLIMLTCLGLGLRSLVTHGPLLLSIAYGAGAVLTVALGAVLSWRTFTAEEQQRLRRGGYAGQRRRPRPPRRGN